MPSRRRAAAWPQGSAEVASLPLCSPPTETRALSTPVRRRRLELSKPPALSRILQTTTRPLATRGRPRPRPPLLLLLSAALFGAIAPVVAGDANGKPWVELGAPRIDSSSDDDDAGRVNVYVYDDPALDQADLIQCYLDKHDGVPPWQDERADMAQDMGEIWLHQALLVHKWRVLDPEDADVFFVPLYPVLSAKLLGISDATCGGRTHKERISAAITHLDHKSTYFKRFGGADHVMVCAWWDCRTALTRTHRMRLRRAVLGVNENIKAWAKWGCGGKVVTVPYTASSIVTTDVMIGGKGAGERDIPFFFAGTARQRPERTNLAVVAELFTDSIIELGRETAWAENATVYAQHITHSRFCFCPRGDSASSRRVVDALSAGCIPVLTTFEHNALPFLSTGLNYSEFAVVAPAESFGSRESVALLVEDLSSRSEEQLAPLRRAMSRGVHSIVYGIASGPELSDMRPFAGTSTRFLKQVRATIAADDSVWSCPPMNWNQEELAPRTWAKFPPPAEKRKSWLSVSETLVNEEHSLLFCAPPFTGSMQFRMLAKRMQGVDHWREFENRELLFHRRKSELPLLNVSNGDLMSKIYKDNGSGWIKIGVVRDPVTRILSAYLNLVLARQGGPFSSDSNDNSSHHDWRRHRSMLMHDEAGDDDDQEEDALAWLYGAGRRGWHQRAGDTGREFEEKNAGIVGHGEAGGGGGGMGEPEGRGKEGARVDSTRGHRNTTAERRALDEEGGGGGRGGGYHRVPTFPDVVDTLTRTMSVAPLAFKPMSGMCGMRMSPFDTVIPFESLQKTSTEVLKSLPGGVWDTYGASGWGPDGDRAFMEFDYSGVHDGDNLGEDNKGSGKRGVDGAAPVQRHRRAGGLFEGDSCEWTKYYTDRGVLETVARLYEDDYRLFGWYDIDYWMKRLDACLLVQ